MRGRSVLGLKISRIADKAKYYLSSAYEVAQAVNEIAGKPKLHNYAALSTILLSKVADHYSFDPSDDPTLKEPYSLPYEFRDFTRKISKNFPTRYFSTEDEPIQVSDVHGWTLVFSGSGLDTSVWYQTKEEEDEEHKVMRAVGRGIWESLGGKVELAASAGANHRGTSMASLREWSPGEVLTSEQTELLLERTRKFMGRPGAKSRSLLLYGPPGTGKSCMIRAIASEMRGTLLFLDSAKVAELDSGTLAFVLDLLAPDIVLIDDLDRVADVKLLLTSIDRLRASSKLLMVTVNNLDDMDPAVTRAGRFDDVIEIRRVRWPRDIVPGLPEDLYEELESWPIAFLEELKVRLEVLGVDTMEEEVETLRARVIRNEGGQGKDENESDD